MRVWIFAAATAVAVCAGFPAVAQVNQFTPALRVAYDIKGAITAKGSSDAITMASNCNDWALGRPQVNETPVIEFMTQLAPVDGQPFYLETVTKDYKGPRVI